MVPNIAYDVIILIKTNIPAIFLQLGTPLQPKTSQSFEFCEYTH